MRELKRDQDLIDFITLDPNKLTISLIKSLIAKTIDNGKLVNPKYALDDYFLLKKGECCKNTKEVITSVGILIMNKWFIEPFLTEHMKYQNQRFDSKMFGKLDSLVALEYRHERISFEAYEYHLNASQSQGQLSEIVSPSYSPGTLTLPPKAAKLKAELLKTHAKELAEGNVPVANEIKAKIIAMVKEELEFDPALENYTSGSKANFDNSYSLMNIMQGPVANPDGSGYTVVTESYDEGIKKEDYVAIANSAVQGIKSRALDVAVGGTIQRKIMSMAQEEVFDPKNKDCKTKKTIPITLRPTLAQIYLGRYIKVGDKTVHLTEDNIMKYIGKTLNFYSAVRCLSPAPTYCEKCLGTHPRTFGITKVGLLAQGAGSALLNSNLKPFHDQSVNSKVVDPNKLLFD